MDEPREGCWDCGPSTQRGADAKAAVQSPGRADAGFADSGLPAGSTAWLVTLDKNVLAMDSTPEGGADLYAMQYDGDGVVQQYDSSGALVWSRPEPNALDGASVRPGGDLLLWGSATSSVGPDETYALLRYHSDGTGRAVLETGSDGPARLDAQGNRVEVRQDSSAERCVAYFAPTGAELWRRCGNSDQAADLEIGDITFDPTGDLIVSMYFWAPGTFAERSFAKGSYLAKLSSAGDLVWQRSLSTGWGCCAVKTSATGTVVAIGSAQTRGAWGNAPLLEGRGFLLVADASGTPRWARSFDPWTLDLTTFTAFLRRRGA